MKKFFVPLFVTTLLVGCDLVETITDGEQASRPTHWMVPHGKMVDIGEEVTSILGTDMCITEFESFDCWKFSLIAGDKQTVILSNGLKEIWTTDVGKNGNVSLVRPNGFVVVSPSK